MTDLVEEIRWWFEVGGYDVSERVGYASGEIDRFAVQRRGIRPPVIWWTVVGRFPDDLGGALNALDEARRAREAERALAIVTDEDMPEPYRPDLGARASNYVTLRYLALHLSGVFDELRRLAASAPLSPHMQKPFRDEAGHEVDGHRLVENWIGEGPSDVLVLRGRAVAAIEELIREVATERAGRCLDDPQRHVPLTLEPMEWHARESYKKLLACRWLIRAEESDEAPWALELRRTAPEKFETKALWEVGTPGVEAVMSWLRASAPGRPTEQFRAIVDRDTGFRKMMLWPTVRSQLNDALQREMPAQESAESWVVSVLSWSVYGLITHGVADLKDASEVWTDLEDGALRSFALGAVDVTESIEAVTAEKLEQRTGVVTYAGERPQDGWLIYLFTAMVVRDWFLARKIAREVRNGNLELLTRHVFPREHVGLFLAVLAPDVASLVGSDRFESLRREVEAEVARRVQLTLGHQLNRAIGAIGAHVRTVRRTFREDEIDTRTRSAFTRIDEELEHLRRLTERSRLLDASASSWELVTVHLEEAVSAVVDPLRERHPDVGVDVTIAADVAVRAVPEALREVVHCVMENAFHSVCVLPKGRPRSVQVSAERDGETVRLRIRDNGGGVRAEDRERIFLPYVTTKTGGPGEPRGTGLGLSIARTFAERMGAKVLLEVSNGETIFVMIFVAGR